MSVLRLTVATAAAGTSLDGGAVRAGIAALADRGPAVGAVLLVGEGPNFCTGGDITSFAAAGDRHAAVHAMARELHDLVRALVTAPVPVVAAVHGWAAGAGMSLACAADIVVGGPSTRFRPAYASIGFSPDGGMSWTLPRAIGAARARDLVLTDGVLTGEEAYRAGLLSRLVPDEQVREEAERVAEGLSRGPRASLARTKRLLWEGHDRGLAAQLDAEADAVADSADGPEGREGVAAFTERRAPRWPAQ
ncbi:MAG TPA: enoyl-CoA hydratase-related protein [Mycobacteriales bacterium]|jgi:2-(1,2-epoxy-1,2-dihydrophenyl)acetyl-CoA isomerase